MLPTRHGLLFSVYADNFPALTPCIEVDAALPFAAYTAAQRKSTAALRLI